MKGLFVALLIALVSTAPCEGVSPWLDTELTERDDGQYFTLVNQDGEVVTMTSRILGLGDSYISSDNKLYTVVGYDQDQINVEFVEDVQLPNVSDILRTQITQDGSQEASSWNAIAVYHTHNAESYEPTSGTHSKENGKGDILEVGRVFAEEMERLGFEVHHSTNSHLPHDGQAYLRSRRTVTELLKEQPATLIDVHRDATPPEVYQTEVQGQPATKVRIVVGRQNQNREATLEFAKRMKAVADEQFPGIIEGIFDARGNYNQDIGPQVVLLEFGAHTNTLEEAKQAASFFAKVVPAAAGVSGQGAASQAEQETGRAARSSIVWIIAIAGLLVLGFVILNKQGIGSIGRFFGREVGLDQPDEGKEAEENKDDNKE